ncbi:MULTISPECIES: hypothetical protein [Paenibacillus]|jgi:hypothetical protein|uniref:Transposase n=2 Tax=Paenibacillus TaxID=44249 RepID=A0ABX2Z4B4_PAEPO|nr:MULTISPECIES: hypothetical protein [Paenibacillus]SFR09181.1 hypothetical protein SAMN04488603_102662 [Paenibacillus sp. cl130]AIW40890.1 hypothetical protein X809_33305 [Paenibacillus polymyxa CR1]ALA43183.1 hypothetical protein ABE82_17365 [Paenibacillus peoriae]APQ60474.1 hypothetical protein VK72_17960 [Paenibacillus polymyxa]MCP3743713.1 hypothetical protein [Paenibacillus sp. A3M_27_13]
MNNVKRIPGFPLAIWSALICVEEISMLRIKYWRLLQKDIRQIVTEQFSEYRHGWAPAYIQ